jgi:hypothetical protein
MGELLLLTAGNFGRLFHGSGISSAADFPGQQVGDSSVARDGFPAAGRGILLDRMGAAFAFERATVVVHGRDQTSL